METADWRAVCGRTARTVRREGRVERLFSTPITSAPIITANWEAFGNNSSNRWVIPIGGGFGKIVKTGGPPLNMNLQGYYNVVNPTQGSDWQLRFTVALLFPK